MKEKNILKFSPLIEKCNIPEIEKSNAIGCYLASCMVGANKNMDAKFEEYLKVLCGLVDKANKEYRTFREYILMEEEERRMTYEEIIKRNQGQFIYFISISIQLEHCLSSLNRIYKIFHQITKNRSSNLKFNTIAKVKNIPSIRNSIEHIDERIRDDQSGTLLFTFSEDGKIAKLGNTQINLDDLASELIFWKILLNEKIDLLKELFIIQKKQEKEIDEKILFLFENCKH